MKQKIAKLKFVNWTWENEKIVERLQMSKFLLHLFIYGLYFTFGVKSQKIEHTFLKCMTN